MQDVLKTVAIADITVSATNPRRHFDENALAELAKSVAQYGVMTPILLRPVKKGYELVCGERRYRASLIAGKTEIPANIRNLTDDEAFELQIIENLERKEVHPLDEAEAFRRMLDSGRYQLADIAAKMAKPETFVVQRLKLNDLIEDIKQDFFDGELNISQAVLIARLEPDAQQELLDGYKDSGVDGYGTTKELQNEIETIALALEEATFSLTEDYAGIQPCTGCLKRTLNSPLLFPDMQAADSCMHKKCFREKTEAALIRKVAELYEAGKEIYLAKTYTGEPSAALVSLAKDYSIPIFKEYSDFDSYDNGGRKIEVLYLNGHYEGVSKAVYVKRKAGPAGTAPASESVSGIQAYTEINRLEDREKRSKELDAEKVHAKIQAALEPFFASGKPVNIDLHDDFYNCMLFYMAILKAPLWSLRSEIKKLGYPMQDDYKNIEALLADMLAFSPEQKKQILLRVMWREFRSSTTGTTLHGQLLRQLAVLHPKIDVDAIQAEQDAIAAARKERSDARIAELKASQTKPAKKKTK